MRGAGFSPAQWRAGMIRLALWYLAGIRASDDVAEQRYLLRQACTSMRLRFARTEVELRKNHDPQLAHWIAVHQRILDNVDKVLHARFGTTGEAKMQLLHALDEILMIELSGHDRLYRPETGTRDVAPADRG